MESNRAAQSFATLGHPGRLAVFRLLMRFAPHGVRPTEIAAALGMKPNTLSHHLADLVCSGLVEVTRQGRSRHYSAALDGTEALVGYLALDVGRARPDLLSPLLQARRAIPGSFNVLFVCSGNSARSIFAEAILRDHGTGRFTAHSAGTRPGSALNPFALRTLAQNGHRLDGLRAKHVSEFQHPSAPQMDVVFTVCDTAAAEECPPWSGLPITGHWGLADPVRVQGTDAEKAMAFARTYDALRRRITAFAALPFDTFDRLALQARIDLIDADALTTEKE